MPPPIRAPGKAARAASNMASAGGAGGQGLPGSVHLRSVAGESSTTGNGDPRSATVRPERRDLRLEAVDGGDHRLEPRRGADGPRDVDLGGEACPVVAAARVEVADEVIGADGRHRGGDAGGRGAVVGIEAEAERGDPGFAARADLDADGLAAPRWPGRRR